MNARNRYRRKWEGGAIESIVLTLSLVGMMVLLAYLAARCFDVPNVGEVKIIQEVK